MKKIIILANRGFNQMSMESGRNKKISLKCNIEMIEGWKSLNIKSCMNKLV